MKSISLATMALLGLVNVASGTATPSYLRDFSTTTPTFPYYFANKMAQPSSNQKTTVQALATTALGGYNCVRNGFIFAFP